MRSSDADARLALRTPVTTRASWAAGSLAVLLAGAALSTGCALFRGSSEPADLSSETAPSAEERAGTAAALAIVERMSGHLASRSAFRFRAEIRYDAVQESGQRIEFGSERRFAVRRPDRLRVDVAHWDGGSELLVYDGAQLSAASPALRVYSSTPQSGTLEHAIARFRDELGAPAPLAELIDPGLHAQLQESAVSASRVGSVRIDGRPCDQLAFRMRHLDFQLFVEQGDAPLPRRLVIDYRDEPGSPQFRASLHDWDVAPDLPDELFRFAPPIGAQRVPFDELLDLSLEPGPGPVAPGGAP